MQTMGKLLLTLVTPVFIVVAYIAESVCQT